MYGSGAVSCSCSLLIRGPNLARCQAEAPLIALCRFSKPALGVRAGRDASGQLHRAIVLQKFGSPSSGGDNDEATSRPRSEPGRVLTPGSADKMLIEERVDRDI